MLTPVRQLKNMGQNVRAFEKNSEGGAKEHGVILQISFMNLILIIAMDT